MCFFFCLLGRQKLLFVAALSYHVGQICVLLISINLQQCNLTEIFFVFSGAIWIVL